MVVSNSINQMYDEMKTWRQDLHRIPEIGLEEYETSKYIKEKLSEFNIEFKDGYANTGIVACIKGSKGNSDKSIGLRADFDALPMPEKNNFDHKSTNDGMMHACGHDGHTSMLLGAAKYLSENNDFDGNVYFIFQPGEEGFAGGQKMIQDGMFDDFKIDEVYALHNWPELPIGTIGVNNGPMMAAVDEFDIIVNGKGGHAAIPQLAIDPVVIASQIVLAVQTIISRSTDPVDKALISITKINGGTAYNVIDDSVKLGGTIRTFKPDTRSFFEKKINEIASGIAKANGAEAKIEFHLTNKYPPTINSKKESEFAANVAKKIFGDANVNTEIDPSMGGEDFSYVLQQVPGVMAFLGVCPDDVKDSLQAAPCHSNRMRLNETAMINGMALHVGMVLND